MGTFSWYTQDTNRRIRNNNPLTVYLCDDKGNRYKETCYEGYGVFGGKDYYELLAEMNGIVDDNKESLRQKGIDLAFHNSPEGYNPEVKHPSLTENGTYFHGVPPIYDPDQGFPVYYRIAAIPVSELTTGMVVMLPKDVTFVVNNRDVIDVEVTINELQPYETVTVEDLFPFRNCIIQSVRSDNTVVLSDLGNGVDFRYSGNVLIPSKKVIHSYMGNRHEGGDLLTCNDCETNLLVPVGTDICPSCHSDGTLDYYDHGFDHVYGCVSDLQDSGYIVVEHDRPEDSMLFSE